MNDINVDETMTLAILSTAFFLEYIEPTKYVRTALGMADCMSKTPAIKPVRSKKLIKAKPIMGPNITLTAPRIAACVQETTLSLVRATPNAINTKKIVVYVNRKVVFSR